MDFTERELKIIRNSLLKSYRNISCDISRQKEVRELYSLNDKVFKMIKNW